MRGIYFRYGIVQLYCPLLYRYVTYGRLIIFHVNILFVEIHLSYAPYIRMYVPIIISATHAKIKKFISKLKLELLILSVQYRSEKFRLLYINLWVMLSTAKREKVFSHELLKNVLWMCRRSLTHYVYRTYGTVFEY